MQSMSALSPGLFLPIFFAREEQIIWQKGEYVLTADDNSNDVGIKNLTTAADDNVADDDNEFINLNYCQVRQGNSLNL